MTGKAGLVHLVGSEAVVGAEVEEERELMSGLQANIRSEHHV